PHPRAKSVTWNTADRPPRFEKQEPPHARSHRRSRHPYRGPDEWQRRLGWQNQSATSCFGPSANSALMDGNGAGAVPFFCGPLALTLDDGSVGFSTRRDDPSNLEFSSIDNDR